MPGGFQLADRVTFGAGPGETELNPETQPWLLDLAARLAQRGAPADFARAVGQLAEQARADGLPVGPLADKAFEGLAKGYAPDRILPVVQALAAALREASIGDGPVPGAERYSLVEQVQSLAVSVRSVVVR